MGEGQTTRMPQSESPTRALVDGLIDVWKGPLQQDVRRSAERSLLNVVATAIGAAQSDAVEVVIATARRTGALGETPILGRSERLSPLTAALAAGIAAHYDDFDDTHLETVIHPGAACLAAVLAVAPTVHADGERALVAFALGVEAQLRIGSAMSPGHYDTGWHITGTCGVLGAAISAGLLLGLDADALEQAVGVAASMTVGVRETFGTMAKSYHPGRAAANGIIAARLVAAGGTGPVSILEREHGYFEALAVDVDWARVTDRIGDHWELHDNTFKPFPCGIVSHPAIHAANEMHRRLPADTAISEVIVRCHALVPELTGNPDPQDGLEARFSTIHGVCAGLADGIVGLPQYADQRVRSDELIGLRARTRLEVDADIARASATLIVRLVDGTVLEEHVEHAPGSLARPLTDEELMAKVVGLVDPVLPGRSNMIATAVKRLVDAPDLSEFVSAITPKLADRSAA
jgi:2-methylcitrate dehydratase PrpD